MSSQRTNIKNKSCATCQFWNGSRSVELNSMLSYALEKAKCNKNTFAGGRSSPSQTCSKWKQWNMI